MPKYTYWNDSENLSRKIATIEAETLTQADEVLNKELGLDVCKVPYIYRGNSRRIVYELCVDIFNDDI